MKRYSKKSDLKENSVMINNPVNAQEAIIKAVEVIGKYKSNPVVRAQMIGEAVITGVDSITDHLNNNLNIISKQRMINQFIKDLIIYRKSLSQ